MEPLEPPYSAAPTATRLSLDLSLPSSASLARVFLSYFPVLSDQTRTDLVTLQLHNQRNKLASITQALQHQQEPPHAAPFLFLFVHNLGHPVQQVKDDDFVLYVPTAQYKAMVEEAERGNPPNEEVEAVRLKALASPHTVIAITSHPSAADGVDSPDHIPQRWRSAHFSLFQDDSYRELLNYLQRIRANPKSARIYQQPPVTSSALVLTSRLPPLSQHLAAHPDDTVQRILAHGRLRVFISFSANDSELTAFHPQAVQLLANALNAYSLFECTIHSLHDTDSGEWSQWMKEEVRLAHYILFIPSARYKHRATQTEGGVEHEMHAITERACVDERSVVCVTFPTIASPADNIPACWSTDVYEVNGSEQSLQRLMYRLIGVENGVKGFSFRD